MNNHLSYLHRRILWAEHRGRILWVSLGRGQGYGCWWRRSSVGAVLPWVGVVVLAAQPSI